MADKAFTSEIPEISLNVWHIQWTSVYTYQINCSCLHQGMNLVLYALHSTCKWHCISIIHELYIYNLNGGLTVCKILMLWKKQLTIWESILHYVSSISWIFCFQLGLIFASLSEVLWIKWIVCDLCSDECNRASQPKCIGNDNNNNNSLRICVLTSVTRNQAGEAGEGSRQKFHSK